VCVCVLCDVCSTPFSLYLYKAHIRRRWIGPTPLTEEEKRFPPPSLEMCRIYKNIIRWKNKFQSPLSLLGFLCVWLFSHYLSVVFNWQKWNIPEERERERCIWILYMWMTPPPTSSSSQSTVCITAASAHKPREVYNFFPFSYGGSEPTGIPDGETIPSPLKINIFFFQPFLSFFVLRKKEKRMVVRLSSR
jgi:hypothetical protein